MNAANPEKIERPRDDEGGLEKKIIENAKIGVPVGTLALAALAGAVQGPSATILVLAGGALVGVIAVFWASVRTLVGETPLSGADAYALGAPRAEEEQKRSVLRALKDLEFERSVGKISEEDYDLLVTKYRAEAKRLLRILDAEAQPRREHVEVLVQKRLRREGLLEAEEAAAPIANEAEGGESAKQAETEASPSKAAPIKTKKRKKAPAKPLEAAPIDATDMDLAESLEASKPKDEADAPPPDNKKDEAAERVCATCGTLNDVDAVFCKKCGGRRAEAKTAAPSEEKEGAS